MEITWYTQLIALFLGIIFIIIGYSQRKKISELIKIGKSAEGVVMRVVYDPDPNFSANYYPVIRFVTADKEWITKQHDVGGELNAYNEGDKLTIIYDPKNPENFIIDDTRSKLIVPLFIVIGFLAVVFALLMAVLLLYPQIKIPYFHI
jgi:Protein of unknown function (DUF3592)